MPELPGGTVTFVFTDVEDSTERLKLAIAGLDSDTPEAAGPAPRAASPPAERDLEQAVGRRFDDIAARMESLGAEIDARVQAALAKKGIAPRR